MIASRRVVLALAIAAVPACALAQKASSDPLAVLKTIYATLDNPRDKQPFSRRLLALYDAASKRSKQLNEPVAGLDFDYAVNGQDFDDDMPKSVRYELLSKTDTNAEVKVTFRNFEAQELRYDLVVERGQWLIDEVRNVKVDPWTLSDLYRRGAKAPKS